MGQARMISGDELEYLNGLVLIIRGASRLLA